MSSLNTAYIVKPVDKALQVLQCLADEGRELTLTEVCYKVRLPKTTVFRYLTTLRHWGLVSYDPKTDLYRLGMHLCVLARKVGQESGIREIALPVMKRLRDCFNETVNLGELDCHDIVYVEIVEARRSLRMQAVVGAREPAYSTALGKVILAFLPDDSWSGHVPARLAARTPATRTSLSVLRGDLLQARESGVAVERGENEEGAVCLAAPICAKGAVVAALSLSAPTSRVSSGVESQMSNAIMEAASEISALIASDRASV